jgi:hypothetical protein
MDSEERLIQKLKRIPYEEMLKLWMRLPFVNTEIESEFLYRRGWTLMELADEHNRRMDENSQ